MLQSNSMMKKIFLTAVLVVCVAGIVSAQTWRGTGSARGEVTDENGNPIPGVKVVMVHTEHGGSPDIVTSEEGTWRVNGIRGGRWNIDFVKQGYKPYGISVRISNVRRGRPIEVTLEKATVDVAGVDPEVKEEFLAAEDLYQAEEYQGALDAFQALQEQFPDNDIVANRIADSYYGMGEYDKAIEAAEAILADAPDNLGAKTTAGNAALKKGDYETSYKYYKELAEAAPNDSGVQANLGEVTLNLMKYEESLAAYRKAIELAPESYDLYVTLSGVQMVQDDYAAAKATLERLKAEAPADHPVFQAWNVDELIALCDAELSK